MKKYLTILTSNRDHDYLTVEKISSEDFGKNLLTYNDAYEECQINFYSDHIDDAEFEEDIDEYVFDTNSDDISYVYILKNNKNLEDKYDLETKLDHFMCETDYLYSEYKPKSCLVISDMKINGKSTLGDVYNLLENLKEPGLE